MWTARVFRDGFWNDAPVSSLTGPFTSADVLRQVESMYEINRNLVRHVTAEIETNQPRRSIETWGFDVLEESYYHEWLGGGKVDFSDGSLLLFAPTQGVYPSRPQCVAWHDRTTVIIPVTGDTTIEVRYDPELDQESRVERMRYRYASPAHQLETIFDWRGYFGNQTAVIDGWKLMRRSGHGFVASIRGTTGFVVGNVLRRLSDKQPELTSDPTMQARLSSMERRHPIVASRVPRLRTAPPMALPSATVFVHGTMSCGLASLEDLYGAANAGPAEPTFRYEHDTFKPLHENGCDLAETIRDTLHVARLTLVAHSRGGLVARHARNHLRRIGYPADIRIMTVGTPHRGTPIVKLAGKALNLFLKLGEEVLDAIPVTSPLMKAYSYLWDMPELPQGIKAMEENSDAIGALDNHFDDPAGVQSFGSHFDIMTSPPGFGVDVDGVLLGYMSDRVHDLVVPLESSLGFGVPAPPLNCAHSHYFKEPMIRSAVAQLQGPIGQQPPLSGASATAGGLFPGSPWSDPAYRL